MVEQHLFGLGLGDKQQERVGGIGQPQAEQPHSGGAAASVELDPERVVAARDQLLGHPEAAQDLQGAWLDSQRPRLVDAVGLPVDDPTGRPERPQLGGQGQAGRPGADDQHVKRVAVGGRHDL